MLHVVGFVSYCLLALTLNNAVRGGRAAQLRVARYHHAPVDEDADLADLSSVKKTAVPSLLAVLETTMPPPLFGAEAVEASNETPAPSHLTLLDAITSSEAPDEELGATEQPTAIAPSLLAVREGAEHRPLHHHTKPTEVYSDGEPSNEEEPLEEASSEAKEVQP